MTIGLFLLSHLGVDTSTLVAALYMLVLGMGLGSVMQVLVLVVQNTVPYSELGVATSGATFFRSIGGSFGTAIFGAIFSNVLVGNVRSELKGLALLHGTSITNVSPAVLSSLPASIHHGLITAYADSIQTVFMIAAPIAAIAFVAAWFLPRWSSVRASDPTPVSSVLDGEAPAPDIELDEPVTT